MTAPSDDNTTRTGFRQCATLARFHPWRRGVSEVGDGLDRTQPTGAGVRGPLTGAVADEAHALLRGLLADGSAQFRVRLRADRCDQ